MTNRLQVDWIKNKPKNREQGNVKIDHEKKLRLTLNKRDLFFGKYPLAP